MPPLACARHHDGIIILGQLRKFLIQRYVYPFSHGQPRLLLSDDSQARRNENVPNDFRLFVPVCRSKGSVVPRTLCVVFPLLSIGPDLFLNISYQLISRSCTSTINKYQHSTSLPIISHQSSFSKYSVPVSAPTTKFVSKALQSGEYPPQTCIYSDLRHFAIAGIWNHCL